MPYGSRINGRIPSRSHHVGTGNRRRFSEIFCFLRILLSCLSRKCDDGGCMVKTRMARFGLTKVWRILTRKPQSLEGAFQWICAQYKSKESKKLTSFPPRHLLQECTSLEVELRKPVSGSRYLRGDSLCHFYSKYQHNSSSTDSLRYLELFINI